MSTTVFALATSDHHANDLIAALQHADVPVADISVLLPDTTSAESAGDVPATHGLPGSQLGGALGWMSGIGIASIPDLGLVIAAGPIVEIFSGATVGASTGGLTGVLASVGVPDYQATRYASSIAAGQVLVCVHTHTRAAIDSTKRILADWGGTNIGVSRDQTASMTQPR